MDQPAAGRRFVRPGVYLAIVVVLLLISGVGLGEARSFEEGFAERQRAKDARLLEQVASQWEALIGSRLGAWYTELGTSSETEVFERRERRSPDAWFDAVYLWDGDAMIFPPPAVEEDLVALRSEGCLASIRELPPAEAGDPERLLSAYSRCFNGPDPQVQLFAGAEAAELLFNAGQPARVDQLLRTLTLLSETPLAAATLRGVDVRRLIILRLQHARAVDAMGHSARAQYWLGGQRGLAGEITLLDAPLLERALDLYDFPLAADLRTYGGPEIGGENDEELMRAARRLAAWRELRTATLDPRDLPALGEAPRVLVDPYAGVPYLIFVSRLGMGDLTGAIQVDQPTLLRWLLEGTPAGLRNVLSIRDADGRVLAGSSEDLAAEATFPRLLSHLRLGLTLSAAPDRDSTQRALTSRLAPFAIALGVGLAALYALIRTDRQQELLRERQRDFVARVSHELKTPLAGIRLMAETLEMGAYRDEAQRQQFAQRIVSEAERLTARVNEVIRAATRPEDDVAVATDIDHLIDELVAAWRPRFEGVGATLTVECERIGSASVMPVLLRDALTNLLDNALKYRKSDRGGRVWLRAKATGRVLIFEVEDDGLGVPASQRKSIFERFRRVEGPGRGKAGGHGLGLSFVAQTAKLHGGRVDCLEGVEGGAKFILRIRRAG